MTFSPIINAPLLIQVHALCALIALVMGPLAIYRKRRDRLHKTVGYVWVVAMFSVATTALFIPSHDLAVIGPLGPIHLFVVLTYWGLWNGMSSILRGDIVRHRAALRSLYWQGLAIAGMFNFLPGRMVARSVFPNAPEIGIAIIVFGAIALIYIAWQQRRSGLRAA